MFEFTPQRPRQRAPEFGHPGGESLRETGVRPPISLNVASHGRVRSRYPAISKVMKSHACAELMNLGRLLSRRRALNWGALGAGALSAGAAGIGLADLLAARAMASRDAAGLWNEAPGFGRAKSCIVMFMWGGPSHLDTWDLKPKAPAEVRGEFHPIATDVAGIHISEHFPKLAKRAGRLAVVRTVTHDDPAHLSSVHHLLTGRHAPQVKSDAVPPSRDDSPHAGALVSRLRPSPAPMPAFVTLPWFVNHPAAPGGTAPGQNAGWLGQGYDPFLVTGDPNAANWRVSGLDLITGVDAGRVDARRALLDQLDEQSPLAGAAQYASMRSRAFDMLTSRRVHDAFRLDAEPAALRDRYGRHIHGQCLLLARRLIEAGVGLVCVNWHQDGQNFWDTHGNNFRRLKRDLMPPADAGFSALVDDLAERGLLEETLLVWAGEFGRRPQISKNNAGREHWPWCGSAVLAGGGIAGGQVYGRSDALGAYPAENPVSPADVTATLLHALGIPADLTLPDRAARPQRLTEGQPLLPLFD